MIVLSTSTYENGEYVLYEFFQEEEFISMRVSFPLISEEKTLKATFNSLEEIEIFLHENFF